MVSQSVLAVPKFGCEKLLLDNAFNIVLFYFLVVRHKAAAATTISIQPSIDVWTLWFRAIAVRDQRPSISVILLVTAVSRFEQLTKHSINDHILPPRIADFKVM